MASLSPKTAAVAAPKTLLPLNFDMALRIAGSFLFVAVHVLGVAFAFIYASSGLLHLSKTGVAIESVVVGIPVLALCGYIFIMANNSERDPDNN